MAIFVSNLVLSMTILAKLIFNNTGKNKQPVAMLTGQLLHLNKMCNKRLLLYHVKNCDIELSVLLQSRSYHALFARARSIISTSARPAGRP